MKAGNDIICQSVCNTYDSHSDVSMNYSSIYSHIYCYNIPMTDDNL